VYIFINRYLYKFVLLVHELRRPNMDVDSDLEQLMSNIGQYYFISVNTNT